MTSLLVDEENNHFNVAKELSANGLPIYVFESNDEEQLLSEESGRIKAAVSGSEIGREALRTADNSIDKSSWEASLEAPASLKVECKCVHGTCREGQAKCNSCEEGWTGDFCSVPKASAENWKQANKHSKKDYTGDGLYRP